MFRNEFTRITTTPARPANRAGLPMGAGLLASTLVETQRGWLAADALRLGDLIQTLDGGLAPMVGLDRQWIAPDPDLHLVHVPGGTISNDADLILLSGQHVLIDTLGDTLLPDAALVLIPATALIGWRGGHHPAFCGRRDHLCQHRCPPALPRHCRRRACHHDLRFHPAGPAGRMGLAGPAGWRADGRGRRTAGGMIYWREDWLRCSTCPRRTWRNASTSSAVRRPKFNSPFAAAIPASSRHSSGSSTSPKPSVV
jgi:Hint domain